MTQSAQSTQITVPAEASLIEAAEIMRKHDINLVIIPQEQWERGARRRGRTRESGVRAPLGIVSIGDPAVSAVIAAQLE